MVWGPAAIKEAARLAGLTDNGKFKAESEQARISALNINPRSGLRQGCAADPGNVEHSIADELADLFKGSRTFGAELAARRAAQSNGNGIGPVH